MSFALETDSLYGRLVSGADVEDALLERLQGAADVYLHEVECQHEIEPGSLERPRSWSVSSELERFPEDQLPAVLVASPGTLELPEPDGHQRFTAVWQLDVGIHVAAGGNRQALRLARLHALALRAAALQQPHELFLRVDWLGERYDTLESASDRSVCTAHVMFGVQVPDVTTRHGGPPAEPGWLDPDAACAPEWPVAVSQDTDVVKVPIEEAT